MIRNRIIAFTSSIAVMLYLMYLQSFRLPLSAYFETVYMAQPYDLKGLIKASIFLVIYLFCLISILLIVRAKNKLLASSAIILFAIFYSADLFVQLMGNNYAGLSISVVSLAFSEADKVGNLVQFKNPALYSVINFIVLIFIFFLYRKVSTINKHGSTKLALISFFASIALVAGSVFAIFSITIPTFPAPIKAPLLVSEYFIDSGDEVIRVLPSEIKPTFKTDLVKSPKS